MKFETGRIILPLLCRTEDNAFAVEELGALAKRLYFFRLSKRVISTNTPIGVDENKLVVWNE